MNWQQWFKCWDRYTPNVRARYIPSEGVTESPFFEEMYQAFKTRFLEEQSNKHTDDHVTVDVRKYGREVGLPPKIPEVYSTQNTLVQGYCLSCIAGIEYGTGYQCRNGCTNDNHKNPPLTAQAIKT